MSLAAVPPCEPCLPVQVRSRSPKEAAISPEDLASKEREYFGSQGSCPQGLDVGDVLQGAPAVIEELLKRQERMYSRQLPGLKQQVSSPALPIHEWS